MQKTKNFIGLFLLMMAVVPAFAMQTEVRKMDSFSAIKSSSSIDVILEKGSSEQVKVESEKVPLEKIITEVKDNTLNIYLKKPNNGWSSYKGKIVVYVSYKSIKAIKSSGSGDVRCKSEISSQDFVLGNSGSGDVMLGVLNVEGKISIRNSGSGDIGLGKVKAQQFAASLSGSGDMKVGGGNADQVDVSVNGSGDISIMALVGKKVSASTSGSGDIKVHATEKLNARISGSGDISYKGAAQVDIRKSGSGSIRKH